jgi:hypothetical protein
VPLAAHHSIAVKTFRTLVETWISLPQTCIGLMARIRCSDFARSGDDAK